MSATKNTIVFFDDYMLREYIGVRKRIFHPELVQAIPTDTPNEIGGQIVCGTGEQSLLLYRKAIEPDSDLRYPFKIYESHDFVNWRQVDNNSFLSGNEIVSPFVSFDRYEPNPQLRYKCTYIRKEGNDSKGYVATSADGINWSEEGLYPFCMHNSDTANNVFYNPVSGKYQMQMRAGFVERRIFCETSSDLMHWDKPRSLMTPSPFDEPCTEYYGLVAHPQDGYFLGYLWKYLPPMRDSAKHKMSGKADTYLIYSYDGNSWNFADSHPLVERPLPPNHGCMCIYLSGLHTLKNDAWLVSGDIRRIDHACGFKVAYPNSERPKIALKEGFAATGIYEIRKDGFAALECLAQESEVILKKIVLNGPELRANINAACGWAKFQLSDENGPIHGFGYENCIVFSQNDSTDYNISWTESSVIELIGKSVTLQIKMYACLLFSVHGDFYSHTGDSPTINLGNMASPVITRRQHNEDI